MFVRSLVIFKIILTSGTNMHAAMTEKVLKTDIVFFDSNPIGRIINRFAKDLGIFDLVMPIMATFVSQGVFRSVSVIIIVSIVNPWLAIAAVLTIIISGYLWKMAINPMIES